VSEPRPRKLRPPIVVRPSFVSQVTAPVLLGLCTRKFLEVLVPKCEGEVVRVGRTVLIPLEVAETALRSMANGERGADEPDHDDGQAGSVDSLLASVGLRRRAAR
jgi:hypothetical protein